METRTRLIIRRLTEEQEARLGQYRDKWLQVALNTQPADRVVAEHWFREAFQVAGLKPPGKFIWEASPFSVLRTYRKMAQLAKDDTIRDRSIDKLTVDRVVANTKAFARKEVLKRIKLDVWLQIWSRVSVEAGSYIGKQITSVIKGMTKLFSHGSHCADWLGVYDYLWQELELRCVSSMEPLFGLAVNCGWWLVHYDDLGEYVVIVSEKPEEVHLRLGQLHREDGPSIGFRDHMYFWHLNGVRVPKKIVETPAQEIPLTWWLDEPAPRRRQVIEQKIGAERIMGELDTEEIHQGVIPIGSTEHFYRLLQLNLPDRRIRRALRMVNPSTGEIHTEWVPREVNSVQEAMAWRNGTDIGIWPSVLT